MVNLVYPKDKLPFPVQSSFTQAYSNKFSRTEMDDGQSRATRPYNSQPEKANLTWRLSWEQLSYWEAWVEYELNGGVNWFDIQISPLLPVESYHMVADPAYSYDDNGEWTVTVAVETLLSPPQTRPLDYLAIWPSELPGPEKSGYSFKVNNDVTRGNIQGAGENGSRRRFTDRLVTYRAKWVLDFDQYIEFKLFLNDELAAGNAYFKAPFTNGLGYGLVKARFIDPPVITTVGAAWVITAQLETTSAPIMSELVYFLGGKLSFADEISLTDSLQILKTGEIFLAEIITLSDQLSRMVRGDENLSLLESLRFKTGKNITDLITLTDLVSLKLRRRLSDTISTSDAIKIKALKYLVDQVILTDSLVFKRNFGRLFEDQILFTETLSRKSTFMLDRPDLITLSDAGAACYQDYAEFSYFAENYVATCRGWSDTNDAVELLETVDFDYDKPIDEIIELSESHQFKVTPALEPDSVTLEEELEVLIRITRNINETVELTEAGAVRIQDYFEVDYLASDDYAGTYIPFLN